MDYGKNAFQFLRITVNATNMPGPGGKHKVKREWQRDKNVRLIREFPVTVGFGTLRCQGGCPITEIIAEVEDGPKYSRV